MPCDLTGLRVLVTRPAAQAGPLMDAIRAAGGVPVLFPSMAILPLQDTQAMAAAFSRLDTHDFAIFISPNAVQAVSGVLIERDWPEHTHCLAVGSATREALAQLGIAARSPAAREDSEGLLAMPELADIAGQRGLILRGTGGRGALAAGLRARGAHVDILDCYRRARPDTDPAPLIADWRTGRVHVVTVTSVEILDNLIALLGEAGRRLLAETPLIVASERIAAAARARSHNATNVFIASGAGTAATLDALEDFRAHTGEPPDRAQPKSI